MKLSAAIELMIVSGNYSVHNEFMCLVLRDCGHGDHVEAVQDMVYEINPAGRRGYPLICALHDNAECSFDLDDVGVGHKEEFEYTKQLYCWWVFDLKRKGL